MCNISGFVVIGLLFFACSSPQKHMVRFLAFDTDIDVTIYSPSSNVERDIDSLKALCTRIEDKLSISKPESEIYRINHRSDSVVVVSDTLKRILSVCRKEYASSGGLFDVTVEPLKYLYGLESHQKTNHVPTRAELDTAMSHIGFGRIRFQSDSILVIPLGMHLDFGGIAKGYLLITLQKFLIAKGYSSFLVNGGGDLIAVGLKPDKKQWVIGIQNPRVSTELVSTIPVNDHCVFTSGDYERFFIQNGIRYHHLFNPKTGLPGRYNSSATVIGTNPLTTDAAVKIAFLMPPEKAVDYLTTRNLPGLLIDTAGVGWANAAMKPLLQPEPGFVVNYR